MHFIKIENLQNIFGQCDYRHLDIDKFIPGSQVYTQDLKTFVGATVEETVAEGNGVTVITEEEYSVIRAAVEENAKLHHQTQEEEVQALKEEVAFLWYELMMLGGM